jgi:HlyD family secretion protein
MNATPKPEPVQPRSWRRPFAVGAGIVAIVVGLFVWQQFGDQPLKVEIEVAHLGPVTRVLAVNGQIAAETSVSIRSAVSGTVLEVLVDEGAIVSKGDVLVQLETDQQEAMLRQAQSALDQGLVQQEQAAANYGRLRDLGTNVTRASLEDASLALDAAVKEVSRLRALMEQMQIQLARYTLRAPISGTVMTRTVDPGQFIEPTTPLFTLSDLSQLIVETDVDEAYATQIVPDLPATLQLVGNRETLNGAVRFVSPRVDKDTGGLAVKIGFDSPLKAPVGLTVTANIQVESREALTVPRTALVGDTVFLLVDGKAEQTPVQVIDWPAARLIVTDGLKAGDKVIVDGTNLSNGQRVIVAPPKATP